MGRKDFKYDLLEQSSGLILFQLNSIWKNKLEVIFKEYEITQNQYAIMASLLWFEKEEKLLNQQDLAIHLKLEKMTLSKSVRILEKQKLILRLENQSDSRSYILTLSAQGRSLIKKAIKDVENLDEKFFNALSKSDRKNFNELCLKLINQSLV